MAQDFQTRLAAAAQQVPRAQFVDDAHVDASAAHLERAAPAQAHAMRLLECLAPSPDDRVLEVGTGRGYVAALLSRLCGQVYTLEHVAWLARDAARRLQEVGADNVQVLHGNGLHGHGQAAPFDGILVSAGLAAVPDELRRQLKVGGRLVAAVGLRGSVQHLVRITRTGEDTFDEERLGEIQVTIPLGDVLVDTGALTREMVEAAVQRATDNGVPLGRQLVTEGTLTESDIYRALARQRGFSFGRVETLLGQTDHALVASVSRAFLQHHRLLPVRRDGSVLEVATCDPEAIPWDLVQALHANSARVYLVTPTDYRRMWAALDLGNVGPLVPEPVETHSRGGAARRDDLLEVGEDLESRLVAMFEALLLDAIGERASDIHLECYDDWVRVRFRVDGRLRDMTRYHLTPTEMQGLVNVVKVAANIDIAEHRLPQGGRFRREAGTQAFDLRVQTQPARGGEFLIIRLLPQDQKIMQIEDLGFPPDVADRYRRLLRNPQGLLLVVGPTGSGKSTTLYAGLQLLAADVTRKVITAEDPIEYSLRGIQQTQVKPAIGFGFANAMRAFVREDPDVILVGEIRDAETALEGIRASQTGHLVLSTLHCNDTVDAVQRLFDLGMHPNSIASELMAVMAQRLARRICTTCRTEVEPDPETAADVFPDGIPDGFTCYRGTGCPRCEGQGTHGRIAAIEFLPVGPTFRRAISRQPPVDELREVARHAGLIPMRDAALDLVTSGRVAFEELPKFLTAEQLAPP